MKHINKLIIILILLLISFTLISCIKEKIVNSNDELNCELVLVQIDFQSGVADNRIQIEFNDEIYFSSMFSKYVPLAGPMATFTTYLARGENKLHIFGQLLSAPQQTYYQKNTFINIGSDDKYYIGIVLSSGDFVITVQENPFGYL